MVASTAVAVVSVAMVLAVKRVAMVSMAMVDTSHFVVLGYFYGYYTDVASNGVF